MLRSSAGAAAPARWCSRCIRSRSRASSAPRDGSEWFEDYLRCARDGAASDRVGDVGGRDRWRHRPFDRCGRRPMTTGLHVREAGADRELRRVRRRPVDHGCGARRMPTAATRSTVLTRKDQVELEPTGHVGSVRHARHVLARIRRCAPRSRRSRSCRSRSRPSARRRWFPYLASCCGRTSGSASPPMRSTVHVRSSAPPRGRSAGRADARRCSCSRI